jgi:peroxiredoxin Q/BCP
MLRQFKTTVAAMAVGIVNTVKNANYVRRELGAGDPAPEFALPGSDGQTYRLRDLVGTSMVVLAWFPKAFTGG